MRDQATIFLIDDDIDDQAIFALALEELAPSFHCVTAKDGIEALAKLRSGDLKPDCIFLDLNMPRMNGKQCLKELRKEFRLSQIPVVIYTTSSESRDKEQMLAMGASAFITKPPVMEELVASLKVVLCQLNTL
jgi:CheY-like chemotaxis protein